MRSSPRLIIAIIIALGSAFMYYTQRSPNEVTGEVQHIRITPDDEIALGLQAAPEMEQQYGGDVAQPAIASYVSGVGQRVVTQSVASRTPYKYQFHVLADPQTINAFALPGGQVFITMGLLRRLSDEAELAGVLGHEIGHVVARHGAEQMSKQQFMQGLAGAAVVASYDPNRPGSSVQKAAMAAAITHMVNMRYGRQDENEADSIGVRLMSAAKYDPRGMSDLMKVLESESGGSHQPEFFSTHPNPEHRLAHIDQVIQEQPATGGERGQERFRQNVLRYVGGGPASAP